MSNWCCSSDLHPNDWVCTNLGTRSVCETSSGPEVGPRWRVALEDSINLEPTGPTIDQLLQLADALNSEGLSEESLKIGQYLEGRVASDDFSRLTRVALIQTDAFARLSNIEEPADVMENFAENWARSGGLDEFLKTTQGG
jgi:hypothetical protein